MGTSRRFDAAPPGNASALVPLLEEVSRRLVPLARRAALDQRVYMRMGELRERYACSRRELEAGLRLVGVGPGSPGRERRVHVEVLDRLDDAMRGVIDGGDYVPGWRKEGAE